MKLLLFILIGVFYMPAWANDAFLVPVATPTPVYPGELLKKRHTGKVLVNLTISAFGTVQSTRILESSHPQLTEATQQAMVKWLYQPWDAVEGKPGNVDIAVPIIFGARGIKPFSREVTAGLQNTLCAYLNHEVGLSKRNFPRASLSEVDVFWHTRKYLSGSYVTHLVPEPQKREALFAALETAIPKIIKECGRNPDARYADYLPQGIRLLLASHP